MEAVERYVPNGTPLTPYEREVLEILAEECAEVVQAAMKLLRFGKENRPPTREDGLEGQPNDVHLSVEYGHVRYVAMLALNAGLMHTHWIEEGRRSKRERLRYYMQHQDPFNAGRTGTMGDNHPKEV